MRPALWMAAAFAVGIAAADWLRPHPALALIAVAACGVWAVCDRRRVMISLLLLVAVTGTLRYAYVQTVGRGDLGAWNGHRVALTGTVVTEPEVRGASSVGYLVSVEQAGGHPGSGKFFVTQREGQAPSFGERVKLQGELKRPPGARIPGGYDRAAHLSRQGVYLEIDVRSAVLQGPGRLDPVRRAAVKLRSRLEGVLQATLPPREAGLMAGLLLGSRRNLTDEIKDAFKASGVFHLLAVSGAHVAMIILPLLGLLRWLGVNRRTAAGAVIPVVLFFVFLTGAGPSVLRAGLMATLVLLGDLLQRERNAVNSLGAAALTLLLWQPTLLFEVGFQLSVSATLGILLFARPIEGRLTPYCQGIFGERSGRWIALGLSATFGAELMVEPLSLHYFGHISLVSPLSNLLLALFLAPVLQLGAVAALAGLAVLWAGWALNQVVRLGIWVLLFTVNATAALPGAYPEVGRLPVYGVVLWYLGLLLLSVPSHRSRLPAAFTSGMGWWKSAGLVPRLGAVFLPVLLLVTVLTWRTLLAGPPDQLTVTFLDVGQGDAIVIRAPGGHTMLIDTGDAYPPSPARGRSGWDAGETVILPYLLREQVRRLDYLVLTHPHQDHAGGAAAVMEGLPVSVLVDNGMAAGTMGYTAAMAVVARKGIPVWQPVAGDTISLGPGVTLEVLGPPAEPFRGTRSDENSNSVVLRLRYRHVALLLTGDMEAEVEERMVTDGAQIQADLIKVAHHGSAYSSSTPFLAAVGASHAVISLGQGNLFSHPSPATVTRLQETGAQVYRTDQLGSITVRTDGHTLRVVGTRPGEERNRPVGIAGRRLIFAW